MFSRIPIGHIHGGETTEGAIDEAIRHSITKMSHLHFVATDEYKNRVIQLGEIPRKVYLVGGLGVDTIKKTKFYKKEYLEKKMGFKLGKKNVLVNFHPVTLEKNQSKKQIKEIRSKTVYNIGRSRIVGAKHIVKIADECKAINKF